MLIRILLFLSLTLPSFCMESAIVPCSVGGKVVVTGGVNSTTKVMQSYVRCTVTVYLTGTGTHATIYSNNSGTALANPFIANDQGFGQFYALDGNYDIQISGGGPPSLPSPYVFRDITLYGATFFQPGYGTTPDPTAVTRPINVKVAERISIGDFGTKGDCTTDDTVAVKHAIDTINGLGKPVELVFPPGCYIVNPLETTNVPSTGGGGTNVAGYWAQITNDYTTILFEGAIVKLQPGHDYAAEIGMTSGHVWYWVYFQFSCNHCSLLNATIDSNGMAQPTGTPQFWATGTRFIKQSGSRTTGNSVVNSRFYQLGGWPVYAEYQDDFRILGNYATGGEGFGVANGTKGFTISGNTSRDAHDAHYYANGSAADIVYDGVISGNVGIANDNGSGIDITGAERVTVTGNTLEDNQNWCILVDKTNGPYAHNPSDNPAKNIAVTGNVCNNNSHYIGFGNDADIVVGDSDDTATIGQYAQNVTVTGNTIHTINPLGTGISAGYGASNVTFDNNFVSGCGRTGLPCQYMTDIISVFRARGANDQIKVTNNHFALDTRYQNQIQLDGSDTTAKYHIWGNTNSILTYFYALDIVPFEAEYIDVHTNLTAQAVIASGYVSASDMQTKGAAPSNPSGEPHVRMYNGTNDDAHIRWVWGLCGTEGSSNAGADLCLYRYNNSGGFISEQIKLQRSDGRMYVDGNFDAQTIRTSGLVVAGNVGATMTLSCPGGQAVKGITVVGGAVIAVSCGAP